MDIDCINPDADWGESRIYPQVFFYPTQHDNIQWTIVTDHIHVEDAPKNVTIFKYTVKNQSVNYFC